MINFTMYQVDAFAENVFEGNPAAVIVSEDNLDDNLMLAIAQENNLSETAYVQPKTDGTYGLRWYTPGGEVDLCGHATLASAHVLSHELKLAGPYHFLTKSGLLVVQPSNVSYIMDFPSDEPTDCTVALLDEILDKPIKQLLQGKDDYLAILESEEAVATCKPDFRAMLALKKRGVIISAKGDEHDIVSRCFYPAYAIDEDPVTGSAHTVLVPYWTMVLKKNVLKARQISSRGGNLTCIFKGDRVALVGNAVTYMKAEITV